MTWQDQYQQEGGAAELFQRYVVPRITSLWAKDLVDRACIRVGESVLDVACGTGVVTRLAAQQSGNGRVVGLDLNAGMLRVARGIAHVDGMSIEWHEGSAVALPFEEGAFTLFYAARSPVLSGQIPRITRDGARSLVRRREAPP